MLKFVVLLCATAVIAAQDLPISGKIVGGTLVQIEDYPYQVSVQARGNHECGGAILDETTILTAAHCMLDLTARDVMIRAGSNKYYDGGQYISVSQVRNHDEFDQDTMNNDIAILKLSKPLVLGDAVKPITINPIPVTEGTKALVTGWGVMTANIMDIPSGLMRVNIDIISRESCQNMYLDQAQVTENMICAFTVGKDACQGDSGGPLVSDGKLIGIVSWGFGCADERFPGVYTNIAKYFGWIMTHRY